MGGVDASLAAGGPHFEQQMGDAGRDQRDTPGDYKQYASQATCLGCVVVEEVGVVRIGFGLQDTLISHAETPSCCFASSSPSLIITRTHPSHALCTHCTVTATSKDSALAPPSQQCRGASRPPGGGCTKTARAMTWKHSPPLHQSGSQAKLWPGWPNTTTRAPGIRNRAGQSTKAEFQGVAGAGRVDLWLARGQVAREFAMEQEGWKLGIGGGCGGKVRRGGREEEG